MPLLDRLMAQDDTTTMMAAAALVFAVILLVRIRGALLTAAILGGLAGGVSLGEGNPSAVAATHATIGFGLTVAALLLIKFTKSLLLLLLVTGLGIGALLLYEFAT
jgi:hypothetical protein